MKIDLTRTRINESNLCQLNKDRASKGFIIVQIKRKVWIQTRFKQESIETRCSNYKPQYHKISTLLSLSLWPTKQFQTIHSLTKRFKDKKIHQFSQKKIDLSRYISPDKAKLDSSHDAPEHRPENPTRKPNFGIRWFSISCSRFQN